MNASPISIPRRRTFRLCLLGGSNRPIASGKDAGRGLSEKLRGRLRGSSATGGTKPQDENEK